MEAKKKGRKEGRKEARNEGREEGSKEGNGDIKEEESRERKEEWRKMRGKERINNECKLPDAKTNRGKEEKKGRKKMRQNV